MKALNAWSAAGALAAVAFLTAGCDSTESAWKEAHAADAVSGSTRFLARHPQGPHTEEARTAIENLEWKTAHAANTLPGYAVFLAAHPQGAHAGAARDARSALESVEGKVFSTAEGDVVIFGANGRALERNGNMGVAYSGQVISFDGEGRLSGTPCSYRQTGEKVALRCQESASAGYTLTGDGTLEGPPAGMFGHSAFARMKPEK